MHVCQHKSQLSFHSIFCYAIPSQIHFTDKHKPRIIFSPLHNRKNFNKRRNLCSDVLFLRIFRACFSQFGSISHRSRCFTLNYIDFILITQTFLPSNGMYTEFRILPKINFQNFIILFSNFYFQNFHQRLKQASCLS